MSTAWPERPPVRQAVFGPDELSLAIARVPANASANHAEFAAAWLCGEEHERCARFLVDHARADFLAGRIAAKTAIRALVPNLPAPARWDIRRGPNQEPVIAPTEPRTKVTLAHAGGVGLAIAHDARWRVGIDLEPLDREADDVIATQVAATEAAWARAAGTRALARTRWLLLWTAREAQGKSLGTGILEPSRLAPTERWEPAPSGWRAQLVGDPAHQVRSVLVAEFVVSLLLPRSAAVDSIASWLAQALIEK